MSNKNTEISELEATPLEKIEHLYEELLTWYGHADKKEQRVAAKLLMVSLDKLALYEGMGWHSLVMEYVDLLRDDPERFQKILESNRGGMKNRKRAGLLH